MSSRSRSASPRRDRRARSTSRSPARRSPARGGGGGGDGDPRRDEPDAGQGVSLLVRNIAYNCTKEVLREAFTPHGAVRDVSRRRGI